MVDRSCADHTSQANIGLTVGGKLTAGLKLADAQLTAYMRGDLSFQASGKVTTETLSFDYRYGVYFLYNLGYKAKANVLFFGNWALTPRELYPKDPVITIYEKTGSIPLFGPGDTPPGSNGTNSTTTQSLAAIPIRRRVHSSPSAIFARADGDSDSDVDMDANGPLSPQPSCPKRADGSWQIPELRLNCDYMRAQTVPRANPAFSDYPVPGLCDPIKALNMLPRVLTYETGASKSRRTAAGVCPTGKCAATNLALKTQTGATGYSLTCDEFPFASTEEGGNQFFGAAQRSATCVSDAQNIQAGQCISEFAKSINVH